MLLSDGAGGYRPDSFYEAAKQTYDAELVDVDGDGDPDVVTAANVASTTVLGCSRTSAKIGTRTRSCRSIVR